MSAIQQYASHPATSQLLEGCSELGLPPSTALQLLGYLLTQRTLLRDGGGAEGKAAAAAMSPELRMDELWHWMLLNSDVRDAVHALVGGDVPHSTRTQRDPEHVKQARRANAAKLMRGFGLLPVSDGCPDVAPGAAQGATSSASPQGGSRGRITIHVELITGKRKDFLVDPERTRLGRVVEVARAAFLDSGDFKPCQELRLLFDGGRVLLDATPAQLGMEDGDTLNLLAAMSGC